ncbi:hypothetical protein ACTVCO_09285 [Sanguibacter sp. A247]|uniref:hypothetical protein n=1 Tax=unclassified Sanguibacter TaxID=2645534 RepID=UPI003FD84987
MRNPRKAWIAGAVVLALVLMALGWFVLVQPKREKAAELNTQADQLHSGNVQLAAKVATLAKQFDNIDAFRAELAALKVRLPADGAVPQLLADLDKLADDAGVLQISAVVSDAQEVVTLSGDRVKEADSVSDTIKGSAGKDAKKDTEKESAGADGEAVKEGENKAAKPASKKPDPAGDKLVAFGTTLTFYGTYNEANDYLDAIQKKLPRYFLVSSVEATSLTKDKILDRDLDDGDVEYVVSGAFYILTDKTLDLDPVDDGEIKLPERKASDNPFSRELKADGAS